MPISRGPECGSTVLDTPNVAILRCVQVARVEGHEVIGRATVLSWLGERPQAQQLPSRSLHQDFVMEAANVCDSRRLMICGD